MKARLRVRVEGDYGRLVLGFRTVYVADRLRGSCRREDLETRLFQILCGQYEGQCQTARHGHRMIMWI